MNQKRRILINFILISISLIIIAVSAIELLGTYKKYWFNYGQAVQSCDSSQLAATYRIKEDLYIVCTDGITKKLLPLGE
jgi:hypothetical protein